MKLGFMQVMDHQLFAIKGKQLKGTGEEVMRMKKRKKDHVWRKSEAYCVLENVLK